MEPQPARFRARQVERRREPLQGQELLAATKLFLGQAVRLAACSSERPRIPKARSGLSAPVDGFARNPKCRSKLQHHVNELRVSAATLSTAKRAGHILTARGVHTPTTVTPALIFVSNPNPRSFHDQDLCERGHAAWPGASNTDPDNGAPAPITPTPPPAPSQGSTSGGGAKHARTGKLTARVPQLRRGASRRTR